MRQSSSKFDAGIFLVILIALVVIAVSVIVYLQVRTDQISEIVRADEDVAILFTVHDETGLLFSEVFIYNPATGRGAFFDVPNNVGLLIDSLRRVDRIAAVYNEQGIDSFQGRVEDLLGTSVPFYIDAGMNQISNLVDLIGGIELFIANPQQNVGEEGAVLLPSGNVLLDGSKIETYLSFEDPAERATEQTSRRQKFLQSFLGAVGDQSQFLTHRDVSPFLVRNVATNLDRSALLTLVEELSNFDKDRVVTRRVQGNVRSVEGAGGGVGLLFPHFEGEWLRQSVRQVRDNLSSVDAVRDEAIVVRVEILNGTTVPGLARRTRELYESYGFDVVSFGNAERDDVEETVILNRTSDISVGDRVADIIGATNLRQERDEGVEYSVHATIILGRDFDGSIVR